MKQVITLKSILDIILNSFHKGVHICISYLLEDFLFGDYIYISSPNHCQIKLIITTQNNARVFFFLLVILICISKCKNHE